MQDRLADLKNKRRQNRGGDDGEDKQELKEKEPEVENLAAEMKAFEEMKNGMLIIRRNIGLINELKIQSNKEANVEGFKHIMKKLDAIMSECKATAVVVKQSLKQVEEDNKSYSGAKLQMRVNMLNTHTKHFADVMKDYSDASQNFQKTLKQRIARQAQIVKPDVTDAEIDHIAKDPSQFLSNALLHKQAVDVIADIEDKHARILEIERGVHYINELFHDLATLVSLQQEHLDLIEQNVQQTKTYTEQGKKDIESAEKHAQSARRWQCCVVVVLVIILVAVLIPVLSKQGILKTA
eukprot:TRINITY_DN2863_c0_g1_i1.p1 TRINITY_DN2863_c0_g1~~TRINITY_DN2863_c0_g1_i1.p1  ORF type:complete len:295 (+),score=76.84 TRINITY_DN2863_c0_g1_i1:118-1002(+)